MTTVALTNLAHALGGTLTDEGLLINGQLAMRWHRPSLRTMAADMRAALDRGEAWHADRARHPPPASV